MKNAKKNFQRLVKDLHRSVREKKVEKIRSLFLKHPRLFSNHQKIVKVVKKLLLEAINCNDERVIKAFIKVLISGGTKNSLNQYLIIALSEGHVQLPKLLLENRASIKGGEESQIDLYKKIFNRKNIKTRKSMIELLALYNQLDSSILNKHNENIIMVFILCSDEKDHDVLEVLKIFLNYGVELDEDFLTLLLYGVSKEIIMM